MTSADGAVVAELAEIKRQLAEVLTLLTMPRKERSAYTVEEVAKFLGKSSYTVREWCREGRINATKRVERRAGAELWSISAAEVERIQNEGLLPPDPNRNVTR